MAALVPSVVLFDLGTRSDASAFSTIAALSALAKTIVIAETNEDAVAIRALKAGASGFCRRDTPARLSP